MNTDIDKTPYFDFFHQIADIIHQIMYSYNIQLTHPPFTKPVSHKEAALNIYPIHQEAPARSPPKAAAPKLLLDPKKQAAKPEAKAAPAPAARSPPEAQPVAQPVTQQVAQPVAQPVSKLSLENKYNKEKEKYNDEKKQANRKRANLHSLLEGNENEKSPDSSPPVTNGNESRNSPRAPRNLVLINAVGDGDCFINAIFDYGLYTNKLKKIYNKIYYLINYILKKYTNNEIIKQINENFKLLKQKFNLIKNNNIINIINKSLFLVKPIPEQYTKRINIQKYYTHKKYDVEDPNGLSKIYEDHRYMFIKYMKFIYALYSLTINFESFREDLKNYYFHQEFNQDTRQNLAEELVEFITGKYYIDNNLKENTNFDKLTIDYIYQFYIEDNIYSSKMEISRFQKMFAEPIPIIDTSFQDDKFFIDHEFLTNIKKDDNYKKEHKDGIKEHNISVINENGNHFLLCLYEDEMLYDFDDKGKIINGMLL